MRHLILSFLALLSSASFVLAQKSELVVKSGDKGLYLEHKVAPKESFYSVGRLYNVHPKAIASYNKLDIGKGLQIDQKVRIPLTDTNFTQQGNTGTPVYYKASEKTGLMKVSKANNDVLLTNLRGWNKLSSDEVKEGTRLIIGFLKSKEMPSVTLAPPANVEEKPVLEGKPIVVEEKPVVVEGKPVVVEEKPVKVEGKPIVVEEKPVTGNPVTKTGGDQGYFKSHFEQQVKQRAVSKDATVTAGIFKTTSGWQDEKYYLLIDGAQPGTIIKVINPVNNKAIYAKVLGEMSGIRQNEGLNIRISNAAASVLGINEQDKFIVKVTY